MMVTPALNDVENTVSCNNRVTAASTKITTDFDGCDGELELSGFD
jgi:hypothetical protein